MENRNFKTIMILMVIIIIMLFNIMQENKQIRNQVNILNNHGNSSQQNLRNDIMYLRNEINDLQEELLKKDAFILDEKFDFISYKDNVSVREARGRGCCFLFIIVI
jgi:peptidoglycan hydrolase CwlO-like protein